MSPTIIQQWTNNKSPGRGGQRIAALVCHIQDGYQQGTINWFTNPDSQASAHFVVGKDGSIVQMVAIEDTAWTNGYYNHPDASLSWLQKGVNPNQETVTVEHEGFSGDVLTPAQLASTIWLGNYIRQYVSFHGLGDIPLNREHIIGHYQLDSVTRSGCPGPGFPWDAYMHGLALLDRGAVAPDDQGEITDMSETAFTELEVGHYLGYVDNTTTPTSIHWYNKHSAPVQVTWEWGGQEHTIVDGGPLTIDPGHAHVEGPGTGNIADWVHVYVKEIVKGKPGNPAPCVVLKREAPTVKLAGGA